MTVLDQLLQYIVAGQVRAFLVGGAVRDTLLGRPAYDIDVTVEGDAMAHARRFADEIGAAVFAMDPEHDVSRVVVDRAGGRYNVDFAQLRGQAIEEDLATRDFTINAMALDISTGVLASAPLIDPFGGREDLGERRLRRVSDTVFRSDPVRLLRAVRFEAAFGMAIDEQTELALRQYAPLLTQAAPERVREEFVKIIAAEHVVRGLRRLSDLGLLGVVLPEVDALKTVTQSEPHIYDAFEHTLLSVGAFEQVQRGGYLHIAEGAFVEHLEPHFSRLFSTGHSRGTLLRLALLLHDIGKRQAWREEPGGRIRFFGHEEVGAALAEQALRRLRMSNEEIDLIATIIANHLRPILLAAGPQVSDRAIYRFFRATGDTGVDVAVHAWCDQDATYGEAQPLERAAELQAVIARLLDRYYHAQDVVFPPLLLTGSDVMQALGIPPGRRVGQVLEALREAQAVGQVSSRDQALDFVKQLGQTEIDAG